LGFQLYTANYLEVLAKLYAKISFSSVSDPFEARCVVVQTQGMASYLKQFLAAECAIAFNVQMPFPKSFCEEIILRNFPDFKISQRRFSPETMSYAIYDVFEKEAGKFPELSRYFSGKKRELRMWQLSEQTARLFDNYQTYRYKQEDFVLRGGHWQSRLWRYLEARGGCKGKNYYFNKFLNASELKELPRKVTVFGVGSLPPLYVDIFFKLSEFTEVEFYYLNPCCCYWADLYKKYRNGSVMPDEELPAGNQLLTSWGEAGRELFASLLEHAEQISYDTASVADNLAGSAGDNVRFNEEKIFFSFENKNKPTLLSRVQQDILEMRNCPVYEGRDDETSPHQDNSLEILNCYAPKREVEILHDKLLRAIVRDGVKPRDIVVMAPDINKFVPLIDAVFSQGSLKDCYTISDRNLQSSGSVTGALSSLLNMADSRMTASEIVSLLAIPAIGKAYDVGQNELDTIVKWIEAAGIRWGLDGEDHELRCGVYFNEFSWRPALDRMMSLFACGTDIEQELLGGVEVPDESNLELFGRFTGFIEAIAELQKNLKTSKTVSRWGSYLHSVTEKFICAVDDDGKNELTAIRSVFSNCVRFAEIEEFSSAVPFDVMYDMVSKAFTVPGGHFSFLRGKITFCSLTPLRSIPAQIIAVLGLNSGEFPRRDLSPGFNLMAEKAMRGDRSAAREDRYLFLEALMSARRNFWLFYDGRTRKSGKVTQPSTVLAELMDYLERGYGVREVKHFLQPFDPAYFRGDELQSFSFENFAVAKVLNGPANVSGSKPQWRQAENDIQNLCGTEAKEYIRLDDIISWAKNPSEYFLKNQLDVNIVPQKIFEDEDMMAGNSLDKWKMYDALVKMEKHGYPPERFSEALQRANMLPVGIAGTEMLNGCMKDLSCINPEWKKRYFEQERLAMQFEECGTVTASLFDCSSDLSGQKILIYSDVKHKHYVNALIRHCALTLIAVGNKVRTSLGSVSHGEWKEAVVWEDNPQSERCRKFMKELISVFKKWSDKPAPLFPGALKELAGGSDWAEAEAAFKVVKIKGNVYGDLSDPFIARCFNEKSWFEPEVKSEMDNFLKLFYNDVLPLERER